MTTATPKSNERFEFTTSKGSTYSFPKEFEKFAASGKVSSIIYAMFDAKWTKWKIHKECGVRYQMVNNYFANYEQAKARKKKAS